MTLKTHLRGLMLGCLLVLTPISAKADWYSATISALASPKGVAAVAMTYALTTAISNFIWAFDWTRAGASDETSKRVQEAGGISASAESLILGFFIPFYCYQYLKHNRPAAAAEGAAAGL